jgi:mannosyl-3-phosphoglycerate phosphatase
VTRPAAAREPVRLLVATDLDGTLLDETDYRFEAAREALARLAERRVPLVLCSSKTRAEMEPLARELGLDSPLIVENGGALLVPQALRIAVPGAVADRGFLVLELGVPRPGLAAALGEIAREAEAELRPFASLSAEDVARLTGLSTQAARWALERHYDEPFLLADARAEPRVAEAARRRGLTVQRGGRFHHLMGGSDKGRALHVLVGLYSARGVRFDTVGIGDAGNDLPLLEAVDRPIVMPRPTGLDPLLAARLPGAERAPAPGPAGWNAAVLAVLEGRRLPAVGGSAA